MRTPMRNVTICLSEKLHHRARLVAAEYDCSLSELVASILETMSKMKNIRERLEFTRQIRAAEYPADPPSPPKTLL